MLFHFPAIRPRISHKAGLAPRRSGANSSQTVATPEQIVNAILCKAASCVIGLNMPPHQHSAKYRSVQICDFENSTQYSPKEANLHTHNSICLNDVNIYDQLVLLPVASLLQLMNILMVLWYCSCKVWCISITYSSPIDVFGSFMHSVFSLFRFFCLHGESAFGFSH